MSKIKFINSEKDYEEALKLAEELIMLDPETNSDEGEQLAILTALIKDYELKSFPVSLPSPVEAIKFRMEQSGLTKNDLIPFIGSKSRVSEIFNGKRQLTMEMVRRLESGLGIPAKVLIQKTTINDDSNFELWNNKLFNEMTLRGYFGSNKVNKNEKSFLLENFFSSIGLKTPVFGLMRKSSFRSSPGTDKQALSVWTARVIQKAQNIEKMNKFIDGSITAEFMKKLVKLSVNENGVLLAIDFLKKNGIIVVIEPHFVKTHLDGAVILIDKNNPIIGLTLRHDRLDNFWFTLMHELAHISLHFSHNVDLYYDEIEGVPSDINDKEKEADHLAQEILLPNEKWEISPAKLMPSPMAAKSLARELEVHVAIIAGQIRYRNNKYIYLNKIVNSEKVRKYFPNEKWSI